MRIEDLKDPRDREACLRAENDGAVPASIAYAEEPKGLSVSDLVKYRKDRAKFIREHNEILRSHVSVVRESGHTSSAPQSGNAIIASDPTFQSFC